MKPLTPNLKFMQGAVENRFDLPNTTQSLIASLKQILEFINSHLPPHALADNINFKAKIIVTELLTNALKHSGKSETSIQIQIDDENISIEKTDGGNPFNPNNLTSLLNNFKGHKAQLSGDAVHSIYALVESENQVRFICEENSGDNPDVNDIMEHFGLLIITKSADEFTYHYDHSSMVNTFNVRLKLR